MPKKKDPEPVDEIDLEVDMLKSKAFRSLSMGRIHIYFALKIKRREQYLKYKAKGKPSSINYKHIEWSYRDAEKETGFTSSTFRRAIEGLREKGFIDVVKRGTGGSKNSTNIYQLSPRWKKYGTKNFVNK